EQGKRLLFRFYDPRVLRPFLPSCEAGQMREMFGPVEHFAVEANGIDGQLRASELGRDRVEDARTVLKVGEEIEAKFTGVDRKSRTISLSIKAKEMHEEQEAVQSYRSETGSSSGTSLGDLLKEQIGADRD
ncbi:MAG TPA: S1 RNA-binding domain-containing protein, partial [Steroidobacteraceae bacterium]